MKKFIVSMVVVGACASIALPIQGGRQKGPKPRLTPFFRVSKEAGFDVYHADKKLFNEMQSLTVLIGPDTIPQFKKPQQVVQLEYGYKKGGVVMIYQCKKVPGTNAKDVFQSLIDDRILRDHQYFKEWSIVPVPDKELFVMVSGTTNACRDLMIKTMKR